MYVWNLEGRTVTGNYMGEIPVEGVVAQSRVTYGGGVQHQVDLNVPVDVYGTKRESVILDHSEIRKFSSK